MSSDPTNPPRRSWKQKHSAVERKLLEEHEWRRTPEVAPATALPYWTKATKLGLAVVTFLVVAGLLLAASFMIWLPQPVRVVLVGAGYEENLSIPHNVYGWQSVKDFADAVQNHQTPFFRSGHQLRLAHEPRQYRFDDAWDKGLDKLTEKTVVVFLGLHGGTDHEGAYLLPQNYEVRERKDDQEPERLLRLKAVLQRLGELPAQKRKLLILDATQLTADWSLGMLNNDFARELKKLEPLILSIPNLVVLSASGEEQRSWVSPEWRQTIFAHYVIEGLKGAADLNDDGRINALELASYVRDNVERWTLANRDALQTPVMLPEQEGEQRAKAIDLTLVQGYEPPNPHELPIFTPPPELLDAWQAWQRLLKEVPSPAVYAPSLWRHYHRALLRYEHLLCAGAKDSAADVGNKLNDLRQEIERARYLDLGSLQNTITMPALAGRNLQRTETIFRQFNELWDARPMDFDKKWTQMAGNGQDKVGRQLLRVQLCTMLVERAAEDPANNLDKAATLLRVLDDPISPRPTTAHYLLMVHRDYPRDVPPPAAYYTLLQLALQVRLQAEQAALAPQANVASYSEQVFLWIQAEILEGDRARCQGTDLLFATDAAAWDTARAAFLRAQTHYQAAQTQAEAVRSALATRDEVLDLLPYYARAVAQSRYNENSNVVPVLEEIWREAHRLTRQLETPNPALIAKPPPADFNQPNPRSLIEQAKWVRDKFEHARDDGMKYFQLLTEVDLPSVLRATDDALIIPFNDPDLRMKLLTNSRRTSRRLLVESAQSATTAPALDRDKNTDLAKREARNQGRMALAILGSRWVNDSAAGTERETFVQAQHRLETFMVEEKWWESLGVTADEIGYCFRRMPVEINRLTETAPRLKVDQARAALQTADRLARQVDGTGSLMLTYNAALNYRQLCAHLVLLQMAERTWQDHWFSIDPNAAPYYRLSGLLFTEDAERMRPKHEPQRGVQAMQQKLTQPGKLVLNGPQRIHVTSEQSFPATYRLDLEPKAIVPSGAPLVWLEPGKSIDALMPKGKARLIRQVGPDQTTEPLACQLTSSYLQDAEANPPSLPVTEQTLLTVRGLYRGQRLELATGVDLHPLADTIVCRQPAPARGSVAVRASPALQQQFGASNGSIAIVLDCSGSMGPPQGESYGPTTKFNEATNALRQVLHKLPRGVTVSLWVFGQALGEQKTVTDVERTVKRLVAPTRWNPQDAKQFKAFMEQASYPALEPWNESPIVRTMLKAKDDLSLSTGFKTMLVLTDGMDNRFEKDAEMNPKKLDIPTALRENFAASGIEINVVGFKVVDAEEAQARKQFEVITQFPIPGKFYTVNQSNALVGILDKSLHQKMRYWIDTRENVPVEGLPEQGLEVSRSGANDQWFQAGLDPRLYKIVVQTDKHLEKIIDIGRGDLLLVNLAATSPESLSLEGAGGRGEPVFERLVYSLSDYPEKPAQEQKGWRLALLQNQQVGERTLQMFLTLEKTADRRETILQEIKPRETWIEVTPPPELAAPFSQRWTYRAGYPAPAWTGVVPAWPWNAATKVLARPSVRVWTNPDQETPLAATLDRGTDFQSLKELDNRPVQVDGDTVTVQNVSVEEHFVETQPGVRERKSCLVVRLQHVLNKPVWSRVGGLPLQGMEQRFYAEVGTSTGLFWPVTQDEVKQALSRLSLISLAAFKRDAEQRGYRIDLKDLPAPTASDIRPEPPISLR